jgi:hypothetical protein
MRVYRLVGLLTALHLLPAATTSLLAQDTTGMKAGTMADGKMDHGKMDKGMTGNGMMMKAERMAPHGMFEGANRHTVSGGYRVVTEGKKRSLVLDADFRLDEAPDAYIVLSRDGMGSGEGTLTLGRLRRKQGTSSFDIPADADLSTFRAVVVWSKKYDLTLGQAELAAAGPMMHN